MKVLKAFWKNLKRTATRVAIAKEIYEYFSLLVATVVCKIVANAPLPLH
jgi:hypothetical protein